MLLIGTCHTMEGDETAEAVLFEGSRIHDLGARGDLEARYPGEERVRMEAVTPGVHDAHAHPLEWGRALLQLDLSGLADPREVAERVAARTKNVAPGIWIRGGGFLFDHYPTSEALDAAAPANPTLLDSRDLHSAWANQAALAAAGVTRETPDPAGGRLLRDTQWAPTGYLLERAVPLVLRAVPPATREDLRRGLDDLARRGYVAVHAMALESDEALGWAEEMAAAGELPLRVWWTLPRGGWETVAPGWRGEDLEVAAVKLFADGSLGSRTAWMVEPYPDGSHGMPLDPPGRILAEGRRAMNAGYTLAVHAIGTRAVTEVLGVFHRLAPLAQRPMRLEHAQHVRNEDLARVSSLPIAVSMQPIHLDEDAELVRRQLPGREGEAFRFRDLWECGVPLAFGSDAPVAPPDLAAGLRAATRHALTSRQSLTRAEALYAFTRGAALAAGWTGDGVIRAGARADLALWEGDRLVGRVWKGGLEWL